MPIATSVETSSPTEGEIPGPPNPLHSSASSLTPAPTPTASGTHTYPPSVVASSADIRIEQASSWSMGMPSWLRVPSRTTLFGSAVRPHSEHAATMPATTHAITEIVSSHASSSNGHPTASASVSGEFGCFSILETPETTVDAVTVQKFRQAFAFDDKENVLGSKHYLCLSPLDNV